ncbi:diguanylate cyclase [Amphritea opalescens]|uniref:diguanylate cyclase n=1 Tax=Amphritea opalescens TaxID=2490544 RepID=A0A430KRV0_9GAMM|nr:diguanylate cyclase [Amphritea opalescens]RTE66239.1 diguanylate cyclase [Amphritea opalescens]
MNSALLSPATIDTYAEHSVNNRYVIENLLESLHHEDFETLADDIKHSLESHRDWMMRIMTALVTRQPLNEDQFIACDAHLHCHFGRWLSRIFEDELFKQGSFLKIEAYHTQLHDAARTVIQQLNRQQEVNTDDLNYFIRIQKELFDMVMVLFEFSVQNKQQFDPTTRLINRRSVGAILASEYHKRQQLDDYVCCIAMADIDHFKNVNDLWGHDVGDLLLAHTAQLFNDSIRRHDTVSRYGGEEFLFIFPDMTLEQAGPVVDRIRQKLADTPVSHQGNSLQVTASFGVTQLSRHTDIKSSIKRADIALYAAKDNGRNITMSIDSKAIMGQNSYQDFNNDTTEIMRQQCHRVILEKD